MYIIYQLCVCVYNLNCGLDYVYIVNMFDGKYLRVYRPLPRTLGQYTSRWTQGVDTDHNRMLPDLKLHSMKRTCGVYCICWSQPVKVGTNILVKTTLELSIELQCNSLLNKCIEIFAHVTVEAPFPSLLDACSTRVRHVENPACVPFLTL